MKKALQTIFRNRLVPGVVIALLSVAFNSCTKSSSSTSGAAAFAGTWNVTSSCGNASLTITASGNTINFPGSVGHVSCTKPITYVGTVSGNNVVITTTSYTDNCGNSATVSGGGSLSGGILSLTLTETDNTGSTTCALTGTK